MEEAKCGILIQRNRKLPEWCMTVRINGQIRALLDTNFSKTLMYPRCFDKNNYLGWHIAYHTSSNKQMEFPAAMVDLEIEGKR